MLRYGGIFRYCCPTNVCRRRRLQQSREISAVGCGRYFSLGKLKFENLPFALITETAHAAHLSDSRKTTSSTSANRGGLPAVCGSSVVALVHSSFSVARPPGVDFRWVRVRVKKRVCVKNVKTNQAPAADGGGPALGRAREREIYG